MITATLTNTNPDTDIFIFINARGVVGGKLTILFTFHSTEEEALANTYIRTDKYLETISMIPSTFEIDMPSIFTNIEGLTQVVEDEALAYITSLSFGNVTNLATLL
jgi:hypothetical protein